MTSVSIGCESGNNCYKIINATNETVALYNKKTKDLYTKASISKGTQQNILLAEDVNVAGTFSIVSVANPSIVYVENFPQAGTSIVYVTGPNTVRPSLAKYKRFFFWPIIGVLVIIAILCFVFMGKLKTKAYSDFCEQDQTDSGIECAELLATQPPSVPNKGFIAGASISIILIVALIVLWLLSFGPLGFASYSACAQKQNYGTVWKWVQPRSGFRKFLCSVFGACECAADSLQEACSEYSIVTGKGSGYKWNSDDAAKSSSSSVCFCCNSKNGECVNILTQDPCTSS